MLDNLQIIFWSITYVLILISGGRSRQERKIAIPYIAGVLNFAWEACALQEYQGFWGHLLWMGLDFGIIYFGFIYLSSARKRVFYISSIYIAILIFAYIFTLPEGMLLSVFAIDLIMAVVFLVDRKKLSRKCKLPIAVTKLIGDAFAGMFYAPQSVYVACMAMLVFCCNLVYTYLCWREMAGKELRK